MFERDGGNVQKKKKNTEDYFWETMEIMKKEEKG